MKASNLPGELDSDYLILETRLSLLVESFVKLGEMKSRQDFFDAFRQLMSEKQAENDEIAVQVLSWAYLELAEKLPVE
jgi:hypothetical protein